jgi:glycosyltransferase involved in cell wall biosynthesis/SAM-dependent methyltransferase
VNVCTIIAKNYVAHARVLAESFKQVHPDGTCHVLVIDEFAGWIDPAEEAFEVLGIDQIGLPNAARMAASYDVLELSTAVKPWFLQHLLARPGIDSIAYLDPDIWVAESLREIDELAREHGTVLTPHFTSPLPRDGLKPSEEDILIAGTYNLGFIALGAGEQSAQLLDWWAERLEHHCVVDPENGHFVDQRWIDLVPGIWSDVHILRDPAYNVAYWNLPTRGFERRDGNYLVDGKPLRFFHFSGFDPFRPAELSRHQNRIDVAATPALAAICSAHAEALLARGHGEARAWPYQWGSLPNGIRLDRPARQVHREAIEAGRLKSSVFSARGAKRFVGYLNEAPGGNGGVSRYARAIRDSREDLREAFPDLEGRDGAAFSLWMHENAAELRISERLLPRNPSAAQASTNGDATKPNRELGVNLAGYLSSELGVGEAARQMRFALESVGVPTAPLDIPVEAAQMPADFGRLSDRDIPFDFNLICVNADMLPELAGAAGEKLFAGRRSAGLWFWEVSKFPQRWRGSFDHVDEVWVASEHIAAAIRPLSPVPVETVRVPVTPAAPATLSRAELGMPEGFCFLFVFDYRSVFRRKNPLGIVEAFRAAFEPGSGASLVLKSVSGDLFPAEAAKLAASAAEHPDIHLIEETVAAEAKNAMIASCDCYVSLHRSEGLGLTMAEAMYFGKPVIATGYSGNLDFMTADNSYLVEHAMSRIGADAGPYPEDAEWAEPDLEDAAERMREVFEHRDEAAARGQRAAADIRRTHSREAAGELLVALLGADRDPTQASEPGETATLARRPAPLPGADPASGRAQLHHLLRFGEPPPRRGSGRFRGFLKRVFMRVLRPYASHQQRINVSAAAAIDELGATIAQLEERTSRAGDESNQRLGEEIALLRSQLDETARGTREALASRTVDLEDLRTSIGEVEDAVDGTLESQRALSKQAAEAEASLRLADQGLIELRRSLGEIEAQMATTIEARAASLAQGLRALETKIATRDEADERARGEAGQAIESIESDLTATKTALEGLDALEDLRTELGSTKKALDAFESDVDGTLNQDRRRVDALAQTQRGFSDEIAAKLAELRARADQADALVQASAAKPYMTPGSFTTHQHPQLGEAAGFEGKGSGGYRGFEDIFRGPEELIRDRQGVYVDLVSGFGPVLDAGCGRGEFLDLLREAGIERLGVDSEAEMVERCKEKGHDGVERADLVKHLRGLSKGSLGTVFSAQVIEHLKLDKLQSFLDLSLAALRPGGLFIAETVNPHSPRALKAFWVDPTHRQPLFPETMLALCQLAGFASAHVFCPMGKGDWEKDRLEQGEYAVVAVAPERDA